jgi:hypothetical protein
MMNVKQSVEWELARETEVLGENVPQCHFLNLKSRIIWLGLEPDRRGVKPATYHLSYGTTTFYLSIYLSMALQPFIGPSPLFSFLFFYTVGRTPWTGDQPVVRPVPTHTAYSEWIMKLGLSFFSWRFQQTCFSGISVAVLFSLLCNKYAKYVELGNGRFSVNLETRAHCKRSCTYRNDRTRRIYELSPVSEATFDDCFL